MCSLEEIMQKYALPAAPLIFNFSSSVKGSCAGKIEFCVLFKLPYCIIQSVTTGQFGTRLQAHLQYCITMGKKKIIIGVAGLVTEGLLLVPGAHV